MKAADFGETFYWGASVSAAQVESAVDSDGKGPSIWDEFCKPYKRFWIKRHHIRHGHQLADGPDFYNRYRHDIDLLKSMGFRHFRFSISWPRILPDGETVNAHGLQFYSSVIDYCLENGITPWVTLYHWDLPQSLEVKGGWTNREVISWFRHFTRVCAISFPQVSNWMVLNEPSVFTGAGYFFGIHAPGKTGFGNFFRAMHHATLCIGEAYRLLKDINPSANVGSTFSFTHVEGYGDSEINRKAAAKADLLVNRMFLEPVIGMGYPFGEMRILEKIREHMKKKDEDRLAVKLDFIGVQTYTREVFRHNPLNPFLNIKQVEAPRRTDKLTAMNWEIHPPAMYHILKKIDAYHCGVPLIITENGIALDDKVSGGSVHDPLRMEYYTSHLEQVKRAMDEGVDLRGYFAWSLMDNFEWAEGYYPRFGLVHIDFESKKRTLKDSGLWFRQFLTGEKNS